MTTKILNTNEPAGYSLNSGAYTGLLINTGISVGGTGVVDIVNDTMVQNDGSIATTGSHDGIALTASGTVSNAQSGSILATFEGVYIAGAASAVQNYGAIQGENLGNGVALKDGGTVNNGSTLDTKALIEGYSGLFTVAGATTVANFATIEGVGAFGDGAFIVGGGAVTNGTLGDRIATIEGNNSGIAASAPATVINLGTVQGSNAIGVLLSSGGTVTNGGNTDTTALIEGLTNGLGVNGLAGTVTNFGTIEALGAALADSGLYIAPGGTLTNGSTTDRSATVVGYTGVKGVDAALVVVNFGSIEGEGNSTWGVFLDSGGTLTNGSGGDTAAVISGAYGVYVADTGSVANFGDISASYGRGVYLKDGGALTNGLANNTRGVIDGYSNGVSVNVGAGTVANFATIENSGASGFPAVSLYHGGAVANGGAGDTVALISGYSGVFIHTAGTVTNFATIAGADAFGVYLSDVIVASRTTKSSGKVDASLVTGSVTNEAGGLITGATSGVKIRAENGIVVNYGAIESPSGDGVDLYSGGTLTNGSVTDAKALVEGTDGLYAHSVASVTNFGTVHGLGLGAAFAGMSLYDGGSVTNGGLTDTEALIDGYNGFVALTGAATIANFATISGLGLSGQYGINLEEGGNLTNGSAKDAKALIEGYGGVVTSGLATVTNFGTIEGADGLALAFASPLDELVVEAGSSFIGAVNGDGGTLDLASGVGTISGLFAGGDVTVSGSMPTTTFDDFGTLEIGAGASFTLTGPATIAAGQSLIDNGTLTVTGALTSAGTLGGTGTVDFTAGTDALTGGTLSVADLNVTGATVTLSGKVAVPSVVTVSGKLLVANGTTLTGAGAIVLTDSASNEITGATATSLLTNDIRIEGEGQLGDGAMELTNAASGSIYSLGAGSLTLNTGTSTIINAGDIVSEGTGGLTISSPLDNTGELLAYSSPLTVSGAVTGTGTAEIENAATLILMGAFNENVTFATGSTGTLELGDSKGYTTGSFTGFSKTGANALDLLDIPFVSGTTTAVYTGTTTSGVLTVTEGANIATIHLTGDYLGSTFTVSSSSAGGTKVVDPAKAAPPHLISPAPLFPQPFIAAMAGFGAEKGAGPVSSSGEAWRPPPSTLAAPALVA
jgi:hypothetical protein